ncbi:MAG: DUF262 domain-containing protein [Bdellovibrionales bacterium]|nr:DUF262 domain-containing protein [Bdellovibrionales bacterium]
MDVSPDKQNLDQVFANTTYYIDFYQRQYKWDDIPVKRLLDDIFYKFNIEYSKYEKNDIELEKLIEKYSWYYLNTYVTNIIEGKRFIVDGQQRLTTLTLILIKLRHLASLFNSELKDWISTKIVGQSGYKKEFWMNHEPHKPAMDSLFKSDANLENIDISTGITAVNMVGNYKAISLYLDQKLYEKHIYESFVFYFLKRLVLINLNVEQTDVPMVFEVINDRGIRLKPYEILKGKLLGEINKEELNFLKLNELWEEQVAKINTHKEDEIDNFFIYYLRSQFANTIGEARNYDRDYHRVIFTPEINKKLKLLHNQKEVKSFLQNQFKYFSNLYNKIYEYSKNKSDEFVYIYYNRLNEMDSQFLLILSACNFDDPHEMEKIKLISYNVDRLFSLLQLQRSYDSNDFNVAIYKINSEIRGKSVDKIKEVFDKHLLTLLSDARGVQTTEVYSYGIFKDTGIELSKRFKRYFFARIEEFIAKNTKLNMKYSLYDLVSNTGSVNGFHIEHILAQNEKNKKLFNDDEDLFERERNRLGGLLLLKGKDNISSNNESYKYKLKSYANTLYWNETLREDTYKSKLDFTSMIDKYKLSFRPINEFGPTELEERHKLLFDIIKIIWH